MSVYSGKFAGGCAHSTRPPASPSANSEDLWAHGQQERLQNDRRLALTAAVCATTPTVRICP